MLERLETSINTKIVRVNGILSELGPTCVLVSGGVDSSLVAFLAHRLNPESVSAIAISDSLYEESLNVARVVAGYIGMDLLEIPSSETKNPDYLINSADRCAICRQVSVAEIKVALSGDYTLLSGVNGDDKGELPGINAMTKLGVRHPLREVDMSKNEIRVSAKNVGLPNWDRPSMACLSSNVPRGTTLSKEQLTRLGRALKTVHDVIPRAKGHITRVRETEPGLAFVVFGENMLASLTTHEKEAISSALLSSKDYQRVEVGLYVHGQMNQMSQ